jgi:uncharacterized membrane protein
MALIVLGMTLLPQGRSLGQSLLNDPAIRLNAGGDAVSDLVRLVVRLRLATPWTSVVLALLTGWSAGVIWANLGRRREVARASDAGEGEAQERVGSVLPTDLFAALLVALALLLTFVPEYLFLRDLFGTRMNTVFKLYYQSWALLAVAAAYALSRLLSRAAPRWLSALSLFAVGILTVAGLWYPALAIPSKADNFKGVPTLDGLAFLRRYNPADMAAIEWIRANVPPDALVLEATGGSYSQEGAGRVSMATGNPTILGWDFHERQWRGSEGYGEVAAGRPEAIDQIYRSAPATELAALLDQWGVGFVYIGALERNKYGISEAQMTRFDSALKRVYDADGVRIYAR